VGPELARPEKPVPAPDHTPGNLAILIVLIGFMLSIPCFLTRTITLELIEERFPTLGRSLRTVHSILENKYYVDELYQLLFVDTLLLANECMKWFDQNVVDRIVNGCARVVCDLTAFVGKLDLYGVDGVVNWIADTALAVGDRMRNLQTGLVQGYLVHSFWVVVLALVLLQFLAGGNL
jgi:NADH-quinone oxidoreductase subunit L